MTFRIIVSYMKPGEPDPYPNEFPALDPDRAYGGMAAFLRDMLHLDGSAVQRITIERESLGSVRGHSTVS